MPLNSIPNSGQSLDQTRDGIRQNFDVTNTAFTVDHVSFNLAGQGKHNKVTFPVQAADPVLAANEIAIFSKLAGGVPALFISDQVAATVTNFTSATKANTGTLTLPSGIIVKWGRNTTDASGLQTFNFATAFPNAIFTAYATIAVVGGSGAQSEANDRYVRIYNYSTTSISVVTFILNVSRVRASNAYNWLAIGY